ncbi:MAG TPA: TetR family transcriptional regulator [Rhizomicrobium sp.]|jgi:AcrR family transcriptional regulator
MSAAQPTTLTKSAIAAAALALIDEEGLESFSTRKLGARLGVEAMALYHHFPSKKLLGDWVAVSLRNQLPSPPADLGWRSWLGQAARGWRAMALAHPNAFPLLLAHSVRENDELFSAQCRVLADAGLGQQEAARTARIVSAFVTGAVQQEIADPASGAGVFERGLVMIFDGIARSLQRARDL